MAVEFSCPYCQQLVRTPLSAAGKKGKCPQCKAVVQIPGGAASKHSAVPATPSRAATHHSPANEAARIEYFCVECGQLVRAPALMAGKKGKCPNCQSLIMIPLKAAGSKSSAVLRRSEFGGPKPSWLTPGVELTPLEELTPIGPPPPSAAEPPDLSPLLDEVLPPLTPIDGPTIARLPVSEWRANLPFAADASPTPRRRLLDIGRRGLPWERDPSTETFFETVRYVLSAPGDAFLTMHREGIGSPVGFFLVAAVIGNLVGVLSWSALGGAIVLGYHVLFSDGQHLVIPWGPMFLALSFMLGISIVFALFSGTIGGFFSAIIYHVALVICGAADGGFTTTYRVVGFGLGSLYVLGAVPVLGQLLTPILTPLVLTYGFMNAHETSGFRAFAATILPMIVGICCLGVLMALFGAAIFAAAQQAAQQGNLPR